MKFSMRCGKHLKSIENNFWCEIISNWKNVVKTQKIVEKKIEEKKFSQFNF